MKPGIKKWLKWIWDAWTWISIGIVIVALSLSVAWGVYMTLNMPQLLVDPAGKCVKVIEDGRTRTCARIPEKHIRVVVAGRVP